MPYTIVKDKDRYCVHNKKPDGSAGKKIACHDTKEEAQDQIAAIHANEDKSAMAKLTPSGEAMSDAEVKAAHLSEFSQGNLSVGAFSNYITQEWENQFQIDDSWVSEIYADKIIIYSDGKYFLIPFVESENGIRFAGKDNWKEVVGETNWIEKSLPILDKIPDVPNPLKAIGENRLGGYLVLWGNNGHKDLHGEYFTPSTKGIDAVFKQMGKLPFMFDHGADGLFKATVLGEVDVMEPDEKGMWHEIQIRRIKLYNEFIKPYVEAGKMGCSSSVFPATRKVDKKTGEIKQWVVSESTGTFTPADPRQVVEMPFKELKHFYKSIGVDIDKYENEEGFIKSVIEATDNADEQIVDPLESEQADQNGVAKSGDIEKMRLKTAIQLSELRVRLSKFS